MKKQKNDDPSTITTMRMRRSLRRATGKKAAAEGRSWSNYVNRVLEADVGKAAIERERKANVLD